MSAQFSAQLLPQMENMSRTLFGRAVQGASNVSTGHPFLQSDALRFSASDADIRNGLSWIILLCGLGATLLIARPDTLNDRSLRRAITVGAVALGAALLLYLLGVNFRYASYGLLLMVVGYVCIAQGAIRRQGSR